MTTAVRLLTEGDTGDKAFCGMIGRHERMLRLFADIRQAAPLDAPILIEGATGTGKELAAQALHALSGVRGPLVVLNVAELAEPLAESELFGSVRGAFTGAIVDRRGLIESAANGTLFLDEAGDLPLRLQAKLLRVLETGRVRAVGAAADRPVRFRLLMSVQRPALELLREGRWRADFYYRVAGIGLRLPALKDRLSDIPLLARHFLESLTSSSWRADAMDPLLRYAWPGNVRELRRVLERAVHQAGGDSLTTHHVLTALPEGQVERRGPSNEHTPGRTLREVERDHIREVLTGVGGDARAAAAVLGLSRSTLYRRLEMLGLGAPSASRP